MIESIKISSVASYTSETNLNLSKSSFIYGANGSGKTTISRIIYDHSKYTSCQINWKNSTPIKAVVYNSDFVRDNFTQSQNIKGVFTLGENQVEIESQINILKQNIDNLDKDIIQRNNTLKQKESELENKEGHFTELFWQTEIKYGEEFKEILTGLRNSKAKFKARIISEFGARKNNISTPTLDELKQKYQSIYSSNHQTLPKLDLISFDLSEYEQSFILAKKIIGSQDVSIANLIHELNNSDWVKQGQYYLEKSHDQCPFCQQHINNNLSEQLEKYFDKTFEQDINTLDNLIQSYFNLSQQIKNHINSLNSDFLDMQSLERKYSELLSIFNKNINELEKKKSQPSIAITLKNTLNLIQDINSIIENTNQEINKHNNIVNNITQEKKNLTNLVWDFIIQEMKDDIQQYFSQTDGFKKAIESLSNQLSEKQKDKSTKTEQLGYLEKQITSIRPTVEAINKLLSSFGFSNFLLSTTQDNKNYQIIRENGEVASATLSEGEKTFITFLYFYHLIKGSHTESGINQNCIIVIDDPISSLDNEILFIVSNLIRKLYLEMDDANSNIKQIIILTHNIYFYKEITFGKKFNHTEYPQRPSYYIVRKTNGSSSVIQYDKNPINTSYELLWKNLRERQYCSSTIQNILRKILENYFKILGGIDLDKLSDKFSGKEQIICNSLCSWINDGSHFSNDDIFVATDDETIEKYLDIFKKIFETQGHIAHYEMMMNQGQ